MRGTAGRHGVPAKRAMRSRAPVGTVLSPCRTFVSGILKEVLSGVAAIEGQTTIEGAQEMSDERGSAP